MDLDALGGKVQLLEAKQDELPLFPGDIVQYTWQGGGGYGDPLERNVQDVIADLEKGYIGETRARKIYGVVAGEAPEDTLERRESMRKERLNRARPPTSTKENRPAVKGTVLSRFGAGLELSQSSGSELHINCECGNTFCGAQENWKEHAATYSLTADELPAGIRLHETMELVEYLCPGCGRRHALDVKERDIKPLHDLKINNWVSQKLPLYSK